MGFQISLCTFHKKSLSEKLLEGNCNSLRWINRTRSSFSESFFSVFILGYFVFQHSPLWASKNICKFHKNSLSERLLEEETVTVWDELTEKQAVSQKASFRFLMEDTTLFTIALYRFQISLSKFHKNSLSERLLEGKAVTLWDELTERYAVSQKAYFQFLS